MEPSENVKFIVGVTPSRYLLSTYADNNNDAKRRVYCKNLAKRQKCSVPSSVPSSVLFSSRYIDKNKSFVKDLFPVPANLHI